MPDCRQPNKCSYFKHCQHGRAFPHGKTLRRNMLLSATGCGTMEDTGDGERAGFQLCRPHIGRSGTHDEDREESDSRLGSAAARFFLYPCLISSHCFSSADIVAWGYQGNGYDVKVHGDAPTFDMLAGKLYGIPFFVTIYRLPHLDSCDIITSSNDTRFITRVRERDGATTWQRAPRAPKRTNSPRTR